jgi:hypothetical protein
MGFNMSWIFMDLFRQDELCAEKLIDREHEGIG